jgi:hypothetical protein
MANTVNVTFAGDSKKLENSFDKIEQAAKSLGAQIGTTESTFDTAARSTSKLSSALDKAEGFSMRMADGMDGIAMAVDTAGDIMSYTDRKAQDLARAHNDVAQAAQDVEQAMADMDQAIRDANQAGLDSEQAGIDLKQALLDQKTAQEKYNDALRKFGPKSDEAKQAKLDLMQADLDAKQASEDNKQAQEDLKQANLDSKQAELDHKDATDQLTESQRDLEKQSGTMQKVSDLASMAGGALSALAGIIGIVTAVQWLWNTAMLANPIGLIIAGIVLLIGAIVLIATKTTWFQDLWKIVWTNVKKWAVNAWNWIKTLPGKIAKAFSRLGDFISRPFKAGFNAIANAWNNTVGRLSWSIPNWVPGVGGNSISAPQLPTFHDGGVVPGAPGQEVLALLQAGETVTPAGQSMSGGQSSRMVGDFVVRGKELVLVLREEIRGRGGNPTRVLTPRGV